MLKIIRSLQINFCGNLLSEARTLHYFPNRGQRVKGSNARVIVYRTYLFFYEIDPILGQVHILRFWHGARDQRRVRLKEESGAYAQAAGQVS